MGTAKFQWLVLRALHYLVTHNSGRLRQPRLVDSLEDEIEKLEEE